VENLLLADATNAVWIAVGTGVFFTVKGLAWLIIPWLVMRSRSKVVRAQSTL